MTMPDTIACLSVRQPWASLIVAGIKPVENRNWYCAHRGPLLIHAGKTWHLDEQIAQDSLLRVADEMGDRQRREVLIKSRGLLGGLVGIVEMTGCVTAEEWQSHGGKEYDGRHEWFIGLYGFTLTSARAFPALIPYKGQQGLFRVPVRVAMQWNETDYFPRKKRDA